MAKRKTRKELITAAVEESFDAFAYLIDQADSDLDRLNAEFVKHGFRVEVDVVKLDEAAKPSKSKAPSKEAKEWNDSFRRVSDYDIRHSVTSEDMESIKPGAVFLRGYRRVAQRDQRRSY